MSQGDRRAQTTPAQTTPAPTTPAPTTPPPEYHTYIRVSMSPISSAHAEAYPEFANVIGGFTNKDKIRDVKREFGILDEYDIYHGDTKLEDDDLIIDYSDREGTRRWAMFSWRPKTSPEGGHGGPRAEVTPEGAKRDTQKKSKAEIAPSPGIKRQNSWKGGGRYRKRKSKKRKSKRRKSKKKKSKSRRRRR